MERGYFARPRAGDFCREVTVGRGLAPAVIKRSELRRLRRGRPPDAPRNGNGIFRLRAGWRCFAVPTASDFVLGDKVTKAPFRNQGF